MRGKQKEKRRKRDRERERGRERERERERRRRRGEERIAAQQTNTLYIQCTQNVNDSYYTTHVHTLYMYSFLHM